MYLDVRVFLRNNTGKRHAMFRGWVEIGMCANGVHSLQITTR